MAYQSVTWTAGDILTEAKLDIMTANDAGFNDGTAIGQGAILRKHLNSENAPVIIAATADLTLAANVYNDIVGATVAFTPAVASICEVGVYPRISANAAQSSVQLLVDGVAQTPAIVVQNAGADIAIFSPARIYRFNLTAVSHTLKLQAKRATGGSGICYGASGETVFSYKLYSQ